MYLLTCDLETTGLNPSMDDWITGSFGLLDYETLEVVREIELTSRPYSWSDEAYRIHKIREDLAMNFPPRKETLQELINFIPPRDEFFFLCHANPDLGKGNFFHFDYAFIKMDFFHEFGSLVEFWKRFSDSRVLSTHTIGKMLMKEKYIPDMKLSLDSLSSFFSIELKHHNAMSDRKAMEKIFARFRRMKDERDQTIRDRDPEFDPGAFTLT